MFSHPVFTCFTSADAATIENVFVHATTDERINLCRKSIFIFNIFNNVTPSYRLILLLHLCGFRNIANILSNNMKNRKSL